MATPEVEEFGSRIAAAYHADGPALALGRA
jgi:hypothetical protein